MLGDTVSRPELAGKCVFVKFCDSTSLCYAVCIDASDEMIKVFDKNLRASIFASGRPGSRSPCRSSSPWPPCEGHDANPVQPRAPSCDRPFCHSGIIFVQGAWVNIDVRGRLCFWESHSPDPPVIYKHWCPGVFDGDVQNWVSRGWLKHLILFPHLPFGPAINSNSYVAILHSWEGIWAPCFTFPLGLGLPKVIFHILSDCSCLGRHHPAKQKKIQ